MPGSSTDTCCPVCGAPDLEAIIRIPGMPLVCNRLLDSPEEAMVAANRHYVEMKPLLLHSGEQIARLVGAEAAFVTPGCGAALALSAAACMSAGDPAKMEQLPDTKGSGLKPSSALLTGLRPRMISHSPRMMMSPTRADRASEHRR